MTKINTISKFVLAIFLIGAGISHFVNPAFFLKIMPPYLPLHKELVLVSGIFEVLLGVLLLVPAYSRWAAWGIVALLIAVFPANLYVFQHQELIPASPLVHLLRLPLQGVFILWAYWYARPVNIADKPE
ncbi:MAG: DoxX family protein [Planctomycetota bacterium]|nr:MAG: DoxX family protein [Planctomycetota bacterium]